jgi:acetoin utilization deacetylase AcuC-like enzyme
MGGGAGGGVGVQPDVWRKAWGKRIIPALHKFKPDLIMVRVQIKYIN